MGKVRSKRLYKFLSDSGVLHSSQEEIKKAKAVYRRLYKKEWKKNRKGMRKEMRPSFSLKEYQELKCKAHESGLCPTAFVRQVTLACLSDKTVVPQVDVLKKVLQLLGMAQNSYGDAVTCVPEAEQILLAYLKLYDC